VEVSGIVRNTEFLTGKGSFFARSPDFIEDMGGRRFFYFSLIFLLSEGILFYKGGKMRRVHLKLGEILIKKGLITEDQLRKALESQKAEGGPLGEVIVKLGMVDEQEIVSALGEQLGIPYVTGEKALLRPATDQDLEKLLPEDFARRCQVLPLRKHLNSLTIACADPLDLIMMDNLRRVTGCEINPIVATRTDIGDGIEEFYGGRGLLEEAISKTYQAEEGVALEEIEGRLSLDELIARAEEAPVVKLVDLIIKQAIDDRASDIHVEPFRKKMSIRLRIDGVLYEIPSPARHLLLALISRIKILTKLDIAEKRIPQDGGFSVKVKDKLIDIRVSVIPTIYGEKVVMRILDKTRVPLDLKQLGFEPKMLEDFERAITRPYGLIFMTGPTGCGKTTTLYAALEKVKSSTKNIITIEDPVEYKLEGINQVQVKPQIGLTFASALRSFLRQDPDIMLVGEVRDLETAKICIQAALTGHLVFSTLHTNDAIGAIPRLINIGIEPFLLGPSLILVAAQRLVRRLCLECKEAYEPTPEILEKTGITSELLYRPKGCEHCSQTGYRGRIGIFEVISIDERLNGLISKGATERTIKDAVREIGIEAFLWEDGMKKVVDGITSLEEVMSITFGDEG